MSARGLAARIASWESRGVTPQEMHKPGSNHSGAARAHSLRIRHTAPQGANSPSRTQRKQGTKSKIRTMVQNRTRGAAQKARKAVRVAGSTPDEF